MEDRERGLLVAEAEPVGFPDFLKTVRIEPLNYGFMVNVGCQSFAIESTEKLLKLLAAYYTDPRTVEKQWMDTRTLPEV